MDKRRGESPPPGHAGGGKKAKRVSFNSTTASRTYQPGAPPTGLHAVVQRSTAETNSNVAGKEAKKPAREAPEPGTDPKLGKHTLDSDEEDVDEDETPHYTMTDEDLHEELDEAVRAVSSASPAASNFICGVVC